jgi:hypothetical protein
LFLRNRFNYLDSKWLAGSYSKEAVPFEAKVRGNANQYSLVTGEPSTSDKFLNRALTAEDIAAGF